MFFGLFSIHCLKQKMKCLKNNKISAIQLPQTRIKRQRPNDRLFANFFLIVGVLNYLHICWFFHRSTTQIVLMTICVCDEGRKKKGFLLLTCVANIVYKSFALKATISKEKIFFFFCYPIIASYMTEYVYNKNVRRA